VSHIIVAPHALTTHAVSTEQLMSHQKYIQYTICGPLVYRVNCKQWIKKKLNCKRIAFVFQRLIFIKLREKTLRTFGNDGNPLNCFDEFQFIEQSMHKKFFKEKRELKRWVYIRNLLINIFFCLNL